MGQPGESPSWLQPLLTEVHAHLEDRITDQDVRARGINPHRVRRWFQKHHDMTFHAYCRTLRLSQAFGRIHHGEQVGQVAFGTGYESLSGFTESFKKATGLAPQQSRKQRLVRITRILTPLGPMLAGAVEDGICLLEFVDRRMIETQLDRLRKLLYAKILPGTSPHFEALDTQMAEYFDGNRKEFALPLVTPGTPFQQRVWEGLRAIPYGTTRSYQEQAKSIGQPTSVRAVARANGDNRIAIVIPCHRVIGKNGKLVGYGGGLWRKQYLLDLEQQYRNFEVRSHHCSSEDMQIRPYRPSDAEHLADLFRDSVLNVGCRAYTPAQTRAWAMHPDNIEQFRLALSAGVTLCAKADGKTVAFGQLNPDDHVAYLYCASSHVEHGYASAIYERLERVAHKRGVQQIHTEASLIAQPFFARKGFRVLKTQRITQHGVVFDRFKMVKRIGIVSRAPGK
jgi:AraC family transcriptional regulator of adaptative response/methylated-DNA-[protein]-cysteine methyltransferase